MRLLLIIIAFFLIYDGVKILSHVRCLPIIRLINLLQLVRTFWYWCQCSFLGFDLLTTVSIILKLSLSSLGLWYRHTDLFMLFSIRVSHWFKNNGPYTHVYCPFYYVHFYCDRSWAPLQNFVFNIFYSPRCLNSHLIWLFT